MWPSVRHPVLRRRSTVQHYPGKSLNAPSILFFSPQGKRTSNCSNHGLFHGFDFENTMLRIVVERRIEKHWRSDVYLSSSQSSNAIMRTVPPIITATHSFGVNCVKVKGG